MMKLNPVFFVIAIAMWLPFLGLLGALEGCQAGTSGLFRPMSETAYNISTNSVGQVTSVAAQVAPFPFNTAIETGGAVVLALLAAWQGVTHSKVKSLDVTKQDKPLKIKS
jgi:hypothetical protein